MENFPDSVLVRIFLFVGDVQDLLQCERTCKSFHEALKDDKAWKTSISKNLVVENKLGPGQYREYASYYRGIDNAVAWGELSTPVTLTVLTVEEWQNLVKRIFDTANLNPEFVLNLRGDTSAVLLSMVEEFMDNHLTRAILPQGNFYLHHKIRCLDFSLEAPPLLASLTQRNVVGDRCRNVPIISAGLGNPRGIIDGYFGVCKESRHSIVRRLAYRAGIARIDRDVYNGETVWISMINFIYVLLKHISFVIENRYFPMPLDQNNPHLRTPIELNDATGETFRNTMPPLVRLSDDQYEYICTIVPAQLEDAAKWLGLAGDKVYGNDWHVRVEGTSSREEALKRELQSATSAYREMEGGEIPLEDFHPVRERIFGRRNAQQ